MAMQRTHMEFLFFLSHMDITKRILMLSAEATTPTRIYIHTKAIQVRTNEEYTQHTHALNVFKKFVSSKLIFTVRRHTYYIYVYLHATP